MLARFMDNMDNFEKVLAVEERLKSRPKKRMKPSDPQPLRAFDGSCVCGCRFTLAELQGPCPRRKKGLLKNLKITRSESGLECIQRSAVEHGPGSLHEKPPDELSVVNDSSQTVY